jgi:acetyl-CoA carboxylase carboxyl transferase subunit alpha
MSGGDSVLPFERPIVELERKAAELRRLERPDVDFSREIERLEGKAQSLRRSVFAKLDPLERLQLARHQRRPQAAEVLAHVVDEPSPLAGDGIERDDPSLSCCLGWIDRQAVAGLGWLRQTRSAAADPAAALRKAQRVIALAERFALPVVTVIDQPLRPTLGDSAAERGAASSRVATREAARCLEALLALSTPTVAVVLGELCSVEGLALAACDRVLMLEHALCAPAPAEVVADRLWDDEGKHGEATAATQLSAQAAKRSGRVDEVIEEPSGGAHRDVQGSCEAIATAVKRALLELRRGDAAARLRARRARYDDAREA